MKPAIFRFLRWALAAGLLVVCFRQTKWALGLEGLAAALPFIIGFGSLIVIMVLISPEMVGKICGFFGDFLSGIIFPDARFSKPPLSYNLARHYARQRRFAEAVEEYEKIIRYYPNERDAYMELIEIAGLIDHARLHRKYVRKFEKRFRPLPPADD